MTYIFGVYIIVNACIYRKIIMIIDVDVDVKFNMYIDLSINMNIKM